VVHRLSPDKFKFYGTVAYRDALMRADLAMDGTTSSRQMSAKVEGNWHHLRAPNAKVDAEECEVIAHWQSDSMRNLDGKLKCHGSAHMSALASQQLKSHLKSSLIVPESI